MIPDQIKELGNVKFLWDGKCLGQKDMQSVKNIFSNIKRDWDNPMLHNLCQDKKIKWILILNNNKALSDRNLIQKFNILKELHHLLENDKVLNYVIVGYNANLSMLKDSTVAEFKFEYFTI